MNLLVPVPVPDARVRVPSVSEALKMERAFGIRSLVRSPLHRRLAGDGAGCYESNYTLGGAKRGLLRPSSLARSLHNTSLALMEIGEQHPRVFLSRAEGPFATRRRGREGGRQYSTCIHCLFWQKVGVCATTARDGTSPAETPLRLSRGGKEFQVENEREQGEGRGITYN